MTGGARGGEFGDILHLVRLQRRQPALHLLQYECLASAVQYLKLFELTARHAVKGGRILDWGCGNGHFSYHLARCGHRVTAYTLEGLPPVLGLIQEPGFVSMQGKKSDPVGLPFPGGAFKAVFSVGVLEHVLDSGGGEDASLKEILRTLEPGGRFVAYHLPNAGSWIEFLARLLPGREGHGRLFTPAGIFRLLADTGFQVLESRRYGFFPRWTLNRLPRAVTNSRLLVRAFRALDELLSLAFAPLCTNLYVVGQKARSARCPGRRT